VAVTDLERRLQAWFSLGVDAGVSFLALALVAVPTFALADTALAGDLDGAAVAIALALALAGTVLFAGQDRALVLALAIALLDLPLTARDPLVILVAWLLALAAAAVLVYHGDDAFAD